MRRSLRQAEGAVGTGAWRCCRSCRRWDLAIELLFRSMVAARTEPETTSLNSALHALSGGSRWATALQLLRAGLNANLQPDAVTCGAAVAALGLRSGGDRSHAAHALAEGEPCHEHWFRALDMLTSLRRFWVEPSIVAQNAAMAVAAVASSWVAALALLADAQRRTLQPDTTSQNTALSALAGDRRRKAEETSDAPGQGHCWRRTLDLLKAMRLGKSAGPDVISVTSGLTAVGRALRWDVSLDLLLWLREGGCGLEPDLPACNAALTAVGEAWRWPVALGLLSSMTRWAASLPGRPGSGTRHRGTTPNLNSYGAVLTALGR
ncbi:unnamed protein product, partial [Polarella glacialis]